MPLALISDFGLGIVKTCYVLEGDGFLSVICYDMWQNMLLNGKKVVGDRDHIPVSPLVSEVCVNLTDNVEQQNRLLYETVEKGRRILSKLEQDTRERLYSQIGIWRACRIFNYHYVATQTIPALIIELNILQVLPRVKEMNDNLLTHLKDYHSVAREAYQNLEVDEEEGIRHQPSPEDLWIFWTTRSNVLTSWYLAAADVALYMTSSACSERIFSLYQGMFSEEQESIIEDRREASVMLRFNENQRNKNM